MKTFELPDEIPAGYSFWRVQVERLGDSDPIETLARTPERLLGIVERVDPRDAEVRPAPDRWSAREHVTHLLDVEFVFGWRIRKILFEERPLLTGMDHEAWLAGQASHEISFPQRARDFAAVRRVNVRLWRSAGDDDFERTGRHESSGLELPLGLLARIQAGHDLVHLDRIEEALGLR